MQALWSWLMVNNDANYLQATKALSKVSLGQEPDKELVVTSESINGNYFILSKFGDSIWQFPSNMFPINTPAHNKSIDFGRLPKAFRSTMKLLLLKYYIEGTQGYSRPRGSSILIFFKNSYLFCNYLERIGVVRFDQVNTFITSQYVQESLSRNAKGKNSKLSLNTLSHMFLAVEKIHELSINYTEDYLEHPWPDSSSSYLSGYLKEDKTLAKTLAIPNQVLSKVFSISVQYLDKSEELIKYRDIALKKRKLNRWDYSEEINKTLKKNGYKHSYQQLVYELNRTKDACGLVILITSGIRISELLGLQANCSYKTVEDDEEYYWIKGVSEKTGEGETSWMVPEIAHLAVRTLERLSEPLADECKKLLGELPSNSYEYQQIQRHKDSLFLVKNSKNELINAISNSAFRTRIDNFAKHHDIRWNFTPHQFRRTFAVYAAHSAYGDLRYLREHFKHWSLDMTALYALNRSQDAEIYDDILAEARNLNADILESWLNPTNKLAGGMAESITKFRQKNEDVNTYESHSEMAKFLSSQVSIRATGVGWCTSDLSGCNGGQATDITRCGECKHSIIDQTKQKKWEGIYTHQIELRKITDIGQSGLERVERDIERCKKVLTLLGADEEKLIAIDRVE